VWPQPQPMANGKSAYAYRKQQQQYNHEDEQKQFPVASALSPSQVRQSSTAAALSPVPASMMPVRVHPLSHHRQHAFTATDDAASAMIAAFAHLQLKLQCSLCSRIYDMDER